MPHISKRKLKKKTFIRIGDQFIETLAGLETPEKTRTFASEFLTYTERIMLAKRLAIALMLRKNYTFREISSTLKVTLQTIDRINKKLQHKKYQVSISKVEKTKAGAAFLEFIVDLLDAIAVPQGRGRAAHMQRIFNRK